MKKAAWGRLGAACIAALALDACSTVWAPASAGSAEDVVVVKAYAGPVQDASRLAVLYGADGDNNGSGQWFCEIDGHDLQRTIRLSQRCANVLLLSPGDHEFLWRYHSYQFRTGYRGHGGIDGTGRLRVHVEAGEVYQLQVNGFVHSVDLLETTIRSDRLAYGAINFNFGSKPIDYAVAEPLKDAR